MSNSNFINEFVNADNHVGAVAPSTKFLVNKMLTNIDFNRDINLVELGPGTGVFTTKILKKMSFNSKLLSIELNQYFASKIDAKINDNRFTLVCDSAEKIENICQSINFPKVDYIISSLPLAVLPSRLKINIINECKNILRESGSFLQFQYSLNAKNLLNKKFKEVNVSFTPLNLPPAFIYHCTT